MIGDLGLGKKFRNAGKGLGSIIGFLTLLFIGLKSTNVIDWSWVWVLSPLWISPMIISFFALIGLFFAWRMKRKRMK
ncbi:MAG: hypothetical protein ACK5MG_09785 [Bacteroidales bacterium]